MEAGEEELISGDVSMKMKDMAFTCVGMTWTGHIYMRIHTYVRVPGGNGVFVRVSV